MIRVISSFADGPVNFHSTGPPEDQIQKLISSTGAHSSYPQMTQELPKKRYDARLKGTQRQFSENICSGDNLRSRIFGTFAVKSLA